MTLDEQLQEACAQLTGTCEVARALAGWDSGDAAWLADALTRPVPPAAIAAVAGQRMPRLSRQGVAEHRRGECPCILDDQTGA